MCKNQMLKQLNDLQKELRHSDKKAAVDLVNRIEDIIVILEKNF